MSNKAGFFRHCKSVVHPGFEKLTDFVISMPARFMRNEGEVIHRGRNELRVIEYSGQQYVVKSFHRPNVVNSVVYGSFRSSKARRSYEYARLFLMIGIGTPQPVGYLDIRKGLLFDSSYYVSCKSDCPYVYSDLFYQTFDYAEDVLRAVGRITALLHEHGLAHKDYSRGNILFRKADDGSIKLEIVDLNRMYIGKVSIVEGCKNFERLPATPEMHRWMAEEYAKARGFDPEECYSLMHAYRATRNDKIDGLY